MSRRNDNHRPVIMTMPSNSSFGFFSEGGTFPSSDNTEYDTFTIAQLNPHPWLDDLRDLARMLEGDLSLPHLLYEVEFKDETKLEYLTNPDDVVFQYNLSAGLIKKITPVITCEVCREAYDRQQRYILSKEI
jgi:hypothetical protein